MYIVKLRWQNGNTSNICFNKRLSAEHYIKKVFKTKLITSAEIEDCIK